MQILGHDLPSEDVVSLIEVAPHVLKARGLTLTSAELVDLLHFLFFTCFLKPVPENLEDSIRTEAYGFDALELRFSGDDEERLMKAREPLINEMITLSTRPHRDLFTPTTSESLGELRTWLLAPHFQLRICGLAMLANFAYQSRGLSTYLIESKSLCETMNQLLKIETNGLVLNTALGAVHRFAKQVEHRIAFGNSGILGTIAASWTQGTNLPLQETAFLTTGWLLTGSFDNVNLFLTEEVSPQKTLFQLLLETFLGSEMQETRSQIASIWTSTWYRIYACLVMKREDEGDSDEEKKYKAHAIATSLTHAELSFIHLCYPRFLEPFLFMLKSENKGRIIATIITLTLMLQEERDYTAIYNTMCQGEGRDVLLALAQDIANPKVQINCRALIQKLRIHYVSHQWSSGLR